MTIRSPRDAGPLGEGQLDRIDDLGAGAFRGETGEEERIGVGLHRVRDQGAGEGGLVLGQGGGHRVEVGDVQRCAPSGSRVPQLGREAGGRAGGGGHGVLMVRVERSRDGAP